ncbi:MAG: hypothetical protein ROO76_15980 [Terriglobia bacterium]|jgi:hypothetical protein|nr:hypothetical protein [Terriglobia bacterium]
MPDGMISDSVVFTSWKEIASYLGKGVRTVQRWEAQFGLPVQRPNTHAKGIVRATREELDQWIATRWSPRTGKFDLPDAPVVSRPVKTGLEAAQELRKQNRALLMELQQSLKQLAHHCQDLAVNISINRELRQGGTFALRSSPEIIESQYAPPYPARTEAKAD